MEIYIEGDQPPIKITDGNDERPSHSTNEFQAWKDTLPKEPEGDVKKNFSVISIDEDAWKYIHELLIADGTSEQYIPSEAITCIEEQKHSKTRSIYLLTPTEVAEIKKHPKIRSVNICYKSYPGTYKEDPNLMCDYDKPNRYVRGSTRTIKNYRDNPGSYLPSSPSESDVNRCGFQLLRTSQKDNPWSQTSLSDDETVLTQSISYYGDGTDVDLIVVDQECWFMHTEFVNTGIGTHNYVPGNVINSSTNIGTCGVLDLFLDAPAYIDPTYFANNADKRMTRWDGTVVPTEAAARAWWTDKDARSNVNIMDGVEVDLSGSYYTSYTRSSVNGGNDITTRTISSSFDHGTPCTSLAYGRTYGWAFNANKWFISYLFLDYEDIFDIQKLFHKYKPNRQLDDTKNPTVSSNSWALRVPLEGSGVYYYKPSSFNLSGVENGSTSVTGYYRNVIANSSDNPVNIGWPHYITINEHGLNHNDKVKYVAYDKDSPIGGLTDGNEYYVYKWSSNTFGLSNFRGTGNSPPSSILNLTSQGVGLQSFGIVTVNDDGTDVLPSTIYGGSNTNGVTYSGIYYNSNTSPKFMSNFAQRVNDGSDGNPVDNRAKIRMEMVNNSMTTAGEEMIDEGVIFVCSAGNTDQKLVKGDHSDYNNYWNTGTDVNKSINETIFTYSGFEYYKTINRPGCPQQIGKKWDGVAGVTTYRTITIGNLTSNYLSSGGDIYEMKRTSSNMGNFVRCYAPGNGAIAANPHGPAAGSNVGVNTYARYDDSYTIGSDTAVDSKDMVFAGTSGSCAVAAGLIATKLQYQRNWTYDNVMNWIDSMPELDSMYKEASESSTVDSGNWICNVCLQGSPARVIFDQQTMAEYGPLSSDTKLRIVGVGLTITSGASGVYGLSLKSG